jgi:peptidoglycan hydrolase-like protein with peptidoglycan-binding domain
VLSVIKRQEYLKALGFYKGKIDGIVGAKTKAAYLALQEEYFSAEMDIDGIYGYDTDILLQNAYNVATYCRNFDLTEFRCQCGSKYCTGYPALLDIDLLQNLQKVRDKFGATVITSGLRCELHNEAVGGARGSRHVLGKAADIINKVSKSESGRKKIMSFWRALPNQRYTYCSLNGNYENMGNAVHVDVR